MAWDGILRRFFAVRVDFEVFPSILKYLPVFALKYFPTDCFPFIQLGASGQLSQMHNKDQKERRNMHLLMKILGNKELTIEYTYSKFKNPNNTWGYTLPVGCFAKLEFIFFIAYISHDRLCPF